MLLLSLLLTISLAAATPKKQSTAKAAPKPAAKPTIAPATLPHAVAMWLANLTGEGKTRVTFTAAATGKLFFFEEPQGVTVYAYDGSGYSRQTFAKGMTLAQAMKKYAVASTEPVKAP